MTDPHRLPDPAPPTGPTVESYFGAFSSNFSWSELVRWPPDVFALTNLVLDHTEAYRFAVSPPSGTRWPPEPGWGRLVTRAAAEWRRSATRGEPVIPASVARYWNLVVERLNTPLSAVRNGEDHHLWEALVTLHAMADETWRLHSGILE